ncbi:hypothetical protein AU509_10240 [Lonsdalea britannica]|uniref:Uncharacterized protein n=1 Tax=Lonsdalea britannica TaxID=1082704 RepID=A0AAD0SFL3_9GAMM|nr:hypothetical protein CKQ53_08215 [Lonsdalea britannica]OSM97066.1 hypothetical protein AU509_10240 [Lonsdalea britannica]
MTMTASLKEAVGSAWCDEYLTVINVLAPRSAWGFSFPGLSASFTTIVGAVNFLVWTLSRLDAGGIAVEEEQESRDEFWHASQQRPASGAPTQAAVPQILFFSAFNCLKRSQFGGFLSCPANG